MKKLMVTGCNGQLGRAVNIEYTNDSHYELVNMDSSSLDISNTEAVIKAVNEIKPYAIINCAAYTAVDKCESKLDLAYRINGLGARNLAVAANMAGAKLMHISTDYVFDGNGTKPYTEFDTPNPQSAYGRTKYAGEEYVRDFANHFFIIRTAWLYGDGNNFLKTMLKLSETHDEINVVKDQIGSPTSAKELAKAIKALLTTHEYGIYHGTCEGQCSWADFASKIFEMAGRKTKVNYITTEEYPSPTKRPAYSVLDNYMFRLSGRYTFASWEDALAVYMKELLR